MVRDGDHEATTTLAPWLTAEKSSMPNPVARQPGESIRRDHHRKSRRLEDDRRRIKRRATLKCQPGDGREDRPLTGYTLVDGLTAAAEPTRTLFARPSLVDDEPAAVDIAVVHRRNRGLGGLIVSHLDEAEALAPAGLTIHHHLRRARAAFHSFVCVPMSRLR